MVLKIISKFLGVNFFLTHTVDLPLENLCAENVGLITDSIKYLSLLWYPCRLKAQT